MSEPRILGVVDRIEGRSVTVEMGADEEVVTLPQRPSITVYEGAVVELRAQKGTLEIVRVLESETVQTLAEAKRRLERLRRRDPGGDLEF